MRPRNIAPNAAKAELRQQVQELLRPMTADERTLASQQVRDRLQGQPQWQEAKTVLLYAPLPDEIDIWPLVSLALAAGKEIFLPRFDPMADRYLAHCFKNPDLDLQPGK